MSDDTLAIPNESRPRTCPTSRLTSRTSPRCATVTSSVVPSKQATRSETSGTAPPQRSHTTGSRSPASSSPIFCLFFDGGFDSPSWLAPPQRSHTTATGSRSPASSSPISRLFFDGGFDSLPWLAPPAPSSTPAASSSCPSPNTLDGAVTKSHTAATTDSWSWSEEEGIVVLRGYCALRFGLCGRTEVRVGQARGQKSARGESGGGYFTKRKKCAWSAWKKKQTNSTQ
jgi:hypothetical protein